MNRRPPIELLAVTGLALLALAAAVYHIVVHVAPLWPTLLGQGGLLAVAVAFTLAWGGTLGRVDTPDGRRRVARRALVFFAATGFASGLYAFHQYLSPEAVLSANGVVFQGLFVALIGGMGGMYVGHSELQLDAERSRAVALNDLHEISREITRLIARRGSREDIEQTVCDALATSESYAFAWIGEPDESGRVVPRAETNVGSYLDDVEITVDESATGQGPTGMALRRNEVHTTTNIDADRYAPWRDATDARGIAATAAVPIVYEGEQFGVLNVYTRRENALSAEEQAVLSQIGEILGLAITAIRHESQLAGERERLEFLNRLIRHNLLNSLTAIRMRTDTLLDHVDTDGREHVATISEQTDEMADLIETLRSLMRIMVDEEDHELEPVDLDDALATQLDRVRASNPDATLDAPCSGSTLGTVAADDLLGEVLHNVLVNAVAHNDGDPYIRVRADADDATVRLHVADDGPGVSPELREQIFTRGESYFDSPGTGFGLYLVREILDSYGGDITVGDSDLDGAVFTLTFQRV